MVDELCLYLELLFFLAGTLLYGFLARTLWRRGDVLAGNWPLRALLVSLLVWYGGTLADHLLDLLVGVTESWAHWAVVLDLVRAYAWLLSFPLLGHTLERILAELDPGHGRSFWRFLPWLTYPTLLLFLTPSQSFIAADDGLLATATRQVFPRVVLHGAWSLVVAGVVLGRLRHHLVDLRLRRFLALLAWVLLALFFFLVVGGLMDPWSDEATTGERVLRTLLLGGLLLPGGLFAFYVQRYNLLRLSLSHRTLRHFVSVVVLVSLVMAAGPTVGLGDATVFRRVVAWGLLLALFGGSVYSTVIDALLRRYPALRRPLGRALAPQEIDALMDIVQQSDLEEPEARERTAQAVGVWLACRAEFLPAAKEAPGTAPLWRYFEQQPGPWVHRLDPPSPGLAECLARQHLHAAFALRVGNDLEGVLGLGSSATGGGYADGELEAVRLVVRQLAATLAQRRLLTARLAEARRVEEQERLGMLGLISASLAHEIKNPLSSMKALAQALREDLAQSDPDGEGVEDLNLIVEQIDRLHRTAQEILGLARPRPGERADLAELIRSALYILAAEARKKAVTLEDAGIESVGPVSGSVAAWQTVVMNLMLNAIEQTPAGGAARVALRPLDDGRFRFETENPGEPLDETRRRRIFEPFVTDAAAEGGTGLGLALVARRLAELGGTVRVDCPPGRVRFQVEARCEGRDEGVDDRHGDNEP